MAYEDLHSGEVTQESPDISKSYVLNNFNSLWNHELFNNYIDNEYKYLDSDGNEVCIKKEDNVQVENRLTGVKNTGKRITIYKRKSRTKDSVEPRKEEDKRKEDFPEMTQLTLLDDNILIISTNHVGEMKGSEDKKGQIKPKKFDLSGGEEENKKDRLIEANYTIDKIRNLLSTVKINEITQGAAGNLKNALS